MTKKDYIKLAAVIRYAVNKSEQRDLLLNHCVRDIATELADVCSNDNPRFDRARFFDACGMS